MGAVTRQEQKKTCNISETVQDRTKVTMTDVYKAIYQDIPSDWRRRPGRPRQSWLATIHRDLQKLDIGLDNVPELAMLLIVYYGGG